VSEGTRAEDQAIGDCLVRVCDGEGGVREDPDDDDLVDDGNECTLERCEGGELEIDFAREGSSCGPGGALECDDGGVCTGCKAPEQCPGSDGPCRARTCDGGVCGFDDEPEGTPAPDDEIGDCQGLFCDGDGNAEPGDDDSDLPFDGNECTVDACDDGEPDFPPIGAGAQCDEGVCDGGGECVGCLDDGDCSADTSCADFFCGGGLACDVDFAPPGTVVDPTPGDCEHEECDGLGGVDTVPDDPGTPCGGGLCDGAGSCLECLDDGDCASNLCVAGSCEPCFAGDECASGLCRCETCVDRIELFVSEYVEGGGANKAIELFNPTTSTIDLAGGTCRIRIYANGDGSPTNTVDLTGSIAAGATRVVCAIGSVVSGCQQYSGQLSFNGDDAVELSCGNVPLDVVGRIGEDPGTEWGSGPTGTADATLRRRSGIVAGDPDGTDPFDPSVEWIGFPNNDDSGIGDHELCGG
jgi:hypothetical protein